MRGACVRTALRSRGSVPGAARPCVPAHRVPAFTCQGSARRRSSAIAFCEASTESKPSTQEATEPIGEAKARAIKPPEQTLVLYEFDPCPFCKKVREMVAYLDLDVMIRPTPQGGPTFRAEAYEEAGKISFPYLVDLNTDKRVAESEAIVRYLADTYGDGSIPRSLQLGPVTVVAAGLAAIARSGRGGMYKRAKQPEQPVVLWGIEDNLSTRGVMEVLSELEIPHLYRSTRRNSVKADEMEAKHGEFHLPLFEDPNTGTVMTDSGEIQKYLYDTYALPEDEGDEEVMKTVDLENPVDQSRYSHSVSRRPESMGPV